MGSPLEAIYFWMYDDGLGSYNIDCTPSNTSGCWGHRNNVLMSLRCQPCLMGAGFNATAYQNNPSWTELLVDSSGSPALDFTWSQVLPYLPGHPGGPGPRRSRRRHRLDPRRCGATGSSPPTAASSPSATAAFDGSMGGKPLAAPIVGIASTPDGHGLLVGGGRRRALCLR